MEEKPYNKWQYSVFTQDRNGQYVIRADSFEEFKTLKRQLDELLHGTPEAAHQSDLPHEEQQAINEVVDGSGPELCPLHNVPLRRVVSKTGAAFYSHGEKMPDGRWKNCYGDSRGWRIK